MALGASKPTIQKVGDYDLVEKIAEGGMGTVYKGRHRDNGQIVAIKLVPPNMANNATLMKRMENEYKAAYSLNHPNIVRAMDLGIESGRAFLVMEFIDGESLGQRLERETKLTETEAIRVIALAAQGLHHAHKLGMIHRDIKPDNIMVTPDGQVKIADFGLVKELETDLNLTRTGRGLGTPHFMAPEQFRNAKNADIRCDIYSLAATLYQMVTGELPFKSLGPLDAWMKKVNNDLAPVRKVNPNLSERIDWAIRRAMSADPENRPSSCREFIEDLTGHSTRKNPTPIPDGAMQDLWYLRYRDEEGAEHMVKGSTTGIRRSLKEGLLGDASNVKAGRAKSGPFEALRQYPEFRDLVAAVPAAGSRPNLNVNTPRSLAQGGSAPEEGPPSSRKLKDPNKSTDAPHIPLEPTGTPTWEWLKLLLLVIVAIAVGVVGALLLGRH